MRAPAMLFLLVLVAALAGCADAPWERRTPVVLVQQHLSWTSDGAGLAEGVFGLGCDMASYQTEPLDVRVVRLGESLQRPDFLVLHDYGDAWRAYAPDGGAGVHSVMAAGAGSGGGILERIFGDAVSTGGSSSLGTPTPFYRHAPELPPVRWADRQAWFDGDVLAQGEPVTRTYRYDVPTDAGGLLHVTHVVTATYLGRVVVTLDKAPQAHCTGRDVPVVGQPLPHP